MHKNELINISNFSFNNLCIGRKTTAKEILNKLFIENYKNHYIYSEQLNTFAPYFIIKENENFNKEDRLVVHELTHPESYWFFELFNCSTNYTINRSDEFNLEDFFKRNKKYENLLKRFIKIEKNNAILKVGIKGKIKTIILKIEFYVIDFALIEVLKNKYCETNEDNYYFKHIGFNGIIENLKNEFYTQTSNKNCELDEYLSYKAKTLLNTDIELKSHELMRKEKKTYNV